MPCAGFWTCRQATALSWFEQTSVIPYFLYFLRSVTNETRDAHSSHILYKEGCWRDCQNRYTLTTNREPQHWVLHTQNPTIIPPNMPISVTSPSRELHSHNMDMDDKRRNQTRWVFAVLLIHFTFKVGLLVIRHLCRCHCFEWRCWFPLHLGTRYLLGLLCMCTFLCFTMYSPIYFMFQGKRLEIPTTAQIFPNPQHWTVNRVDSVRTHPGATSPSRVLIWN